MASSILDLDIESGNFSEDFDLRKIGAKKYSRNAELLMVGASLNNEPVKVYDCYNDELPSDFIELLLDPDVEKIAWNESFDRSVLSATLGIELPANQWSCTMAQVASLGLPQSLKMCAQVLGLPEQKDDRGKEFLNYFCSPCKKTKVNNYRIRNLPEHKPDLWEIGKQYCEQDVRTQQRIRTYLQNFPLQEFDEQVFYLSQNINDTGWAIDPTFIDQAIKFEETFAEQRRKRLFEITGIDSPTKRDAIHKWLQEAEGLNIPSLTKQEIPEWLDKASPKGKEVLELRMAGSQTSKAKYSKFNSYNCDGRVYEMFRFYGAHTGRFSGNGPQLQNVPRSTLSQTDLDIARSLIHEGQFDEVEALFDNPSDILKQLIRSCLTTNKNYLVVCDLSAIEARILGWLAKEDWVVDVFKGDGKIYERTAEKMFNLPEGSVTKNSPERMKGKVANLSLGYQGGKGALQQMGATRSGLTEEELPAIISAYRQANPNIVAFWNEITQLIILALGKGESQVYQPYKDRDPLLKIKYTKGSAFLFIKLPSGRNISYYKPRLALDTFGNPQFVYSGMKSLPGGSKPIWTPSIEMYGGKITNNIVQGIARDVLAVGMMRAAEQGLKIVGHIHDEIVCESDDEKTLDVLERCMSEEISWAKGLPLSAEGFICKNYRK